MRTVRRIGLAIGVALLAGGWVAAAAAAPTTPTPAAAAKAPGHRAPAGFEKAKFGMTFAQVQRFYPALAPAPPATAAAFFRSPSLKRYMLRGIKVRGLKNPCSIELRFWNDQLWSIVFYYGTNSFADVVTNLTHSYGPPAVNHNDTSWTLETASITTSPGQMWYSFDSSAISKDVQRALLDAIQQQQARKAALALPGQTPTAGQAAPAR